VTELTCSVFQRAWLARMARWGEGDPRWIVEERPDATNVNNWHWTEKNADSWSKARLRALLLGVEVEDAARGVVVRVAAVEGCEGEARVSSRKGRVIFLYDWSITLAWVATVAGKEVRGRLAVPSLSEEHEGRMEEVEVEVSLVGMRSEEARVVEELLTRGQGRATILGQLEAYVAQLKEEYGAGSLLPSKEGGQVAPKAPISKPSSVSVQKPATRKVEVSKTVVKKTEISKTGSSKRRRKKGQGSGDLLFYVSLVSIVGLSAVVAVRLARAC